MQTSTADSRDKREALREALRVLKPGCKFAFQDLFLLEREFGKIDDLIQGIQSWGIHKVEFVETRRRLCLAGAQAAVYGWDNGFVIRRKVKSAVRSGFPLSVP